MTVAIVVTVGSICAALAWMSASVFFVALLALATILATECWSRATAAALAGQGFVAARLSAGCALVTVLVASPLAEHARVARLTEMARRISLPDPARASPDAVFAAEQAVDRITRLDLARELAADRKSVV